MKDLIFAFFFCSSGVVSILNGLTVLTYDERYNRSIIAALFIFSGLILITEGLFFITNYRWVQWVQVTIFVVYGIVGLFALEVIRTDKNRKNKK